MERTCQNWPARSWIIRLPDIRGDSEGFKEQTGHRSEIRKQTATNKTTGIHTDKQMNRQKSKEKVENISHHQFFNERRQFQ